MSVEELFAITEGDTVWDAWLTTSNLLDLLEHQEGIVQRYDFAGTRDKMSRVSSVAELHRIDKAGESCRCGLSPAEHALLKRKIMTFFSMQVANLKHFLC